MELTQELIDTLAGIKNGKPWQWRKKDSDEWHESIGPAGENFLPLKRVCKGFEIRLKPEPDPYAEAKQAWKDGELQYLTDCDTWANWSSHHTPSFDNPPSRYRRKPKPVRVPLGPEDVPPGSVFRMPDDSGWMLANEISRVSIRIGREPLKFDWLMQYGWLINRPANRDENGKPTKWEPCWKEGE